VEHTDPLLIAHRLESHLGFLWLNPSENWTDVNNTLNTESSVRFISESGFIDFFLFPGNTETISNSFTSLTEKLQFPSIFILMFLQCRSGYLSQDKVVQISKGLDQGLVPHDILCLDIDYTNDRKYVTFLPSNFQDPHKLLDYLNESKRKPIVLIDPRLKADSNYGIYEKARKKDVFLF
jgi:alpha 1,3-glucosidase